MPESHIKDWTSTRLSLVQYLLKIKLQIYSRLYIKISVVRLSDLQDSSENKVYPYNKTSSNTSCDWLKIYIPLTNGVCLFMRNWDVKKLRRYNANFDWKTISIQTVFLSPAVQRLDLHNSGPKKMWPTVWYTSNRAMGWLLQNFQSRW